MKDHVYYIMTYILFINKIINLLVKHRFIFELATGGRWEMYKSRMEDIGVGGGRQHMMVT